MLIKPDEDVAIDHVTDHLKTSYSDSRTPSEIEIAVDIAHAFFKGFPIRTYVPVLVERRARRILTKDSGRTSTATEPVTDRLRHI
ncbi:three-helix bundle dimerization domain-containing protein [Streptomyces prunicolor]|uniref:three-helix bundle dimerization domain-containing protein n=1 Tax=Streptomyces prunicolor TaxID=67348 RepID=UPI00036E84B2|nr:hypothetical protein [Streptomyces prunicolor]